jgi:transposase
MKKQKQKKKQVIIKMSKEMTVINAHAAGVDIGDIEHFIAVESGEGYEVRRYDAFTVDLKAIVKWLIAIGITTVAMESTGVYWLQLFLLLEEAGIEVYLVNAKHVKNVTGRKKDDTDAIWIQKLHRCGLLQKSFQPEHEQRVLRNYTRQRKNLVTIASDSSRRMQKALELMNIKVHTVLSDLLGKSGMSIVEALLKGERNPEVLAALCDQRIKATQEEIIKSLEGLWSEEYLFMLQQAYDEYKFYQKQIQDCDKKIQEQLLRQVAIVKEGDITDIPQENSAPEANQTTSAYGEKGLPQEKVMKKKAAKNKINFDVAAYLTVLFGVNLCAIPGVNEITGLELLAETGTDMDKWKSVKHYVAWLNLAPNTKITGGKVVSSKVMKKKNRAGQTLKMSASTLSRNKGPLGDYYRRIRAKLGGKGAVLATAHKLAKIIYIMIKEKKEYNPELLNESQEIYKLRRIKQLERQLAHLKAA